jgi:polysaccharide export outer membrane protein
LEEARLKIQDLYNQQIRDTEIFIAYKERIARKVEMMGLTGMSSVPVDGKMRLYDLLSKARIPIDANLFKSYVLRDGKMLPVDLRKLVKEGDMEQNIVMRGGDKVYIAEASASTLMVMGEVARERSLAVPNGFMSLRQALAEAGGISYTGDKSYIQVIRGSICKPKIYTLSWEHVIHLPNDSLLLMPGDIVYVAATPITEWNRFISQLLPSFSGVDVMFKSCSGWGIIIP